MRDSGNELAAMAAQWRGFIATEACDIAIAKAGGTPPPERVFRRQRQTSGVWESHADSP
jgi:hypothetical protein